MIHTDHNGVDFKFTFQNADVAFPIYVDWKRTDEDNLVMFGKTGGATINEPACERDDVVRARGVYWIEMIVDDSLIGFVHGFYRRG